tara:strand:+ start:249 stop:446 length:198 start_codon:yes stop_codon:yes gene_type:complete
MLELNRHVMFKAIPDAEGAWAGITQLSQLMKNYKNAYPEMSIDRLIEVIKMDMGTLAKWDDSFRQ